MLKLIGEFCSQLVRGGGSHTWIPTAEKSHVTPLITYFTTKALTQTDLKVDLQRQNNFELLRGQFVVFNHPGMFIFFFLKHI